MTRISMKKIAWAIGASLIVYGFGDLMNEAGFLTDPILLIGYGGIGGQLVRFIINLG